VDPSQNIYNDNALRQKKHVMEINGEEVPIQEWMRNTSTGNDFGAVPQEPIYNKNPVTQGQNNITILNRQSKYNLLQKDVFEIFVKKKEIVEVRILKVRGQSPVWNGFARGTVSGYFDNFEAFKNAVTRAIKNQQANIYFTLQVIDPRLIGRAYNKLVATDLTTSDNDVLFYRWIPIDLDVKRPSGISATDSELKEAIEIRGVICEWIVDAIKYPEPITAISGNGAHILIKLPKDLPVNNDSKEGIKLILNKLHNNFSTDLVEVDTSVFNPARIWKLYGTKAIKGEEVPGTQYREALIHRESYIDNLGGGYEV